MRFSDTAGLLTYRQSRFRLRLACKDARGRATLGTKHKGCG